jgi:hypothetical protein
LDATWIHVGIPRGGNRINLFKLFVKSDATKRIKLFNYTAPNILRCWDDIF